MKKIIALLCAIAISSIIVLVGINRGQYVPIILEIYSDNIQTMGFLHLNGSGFVELPLHSISSSSADSVRGTFMGFRRLVQQGESASEMLIQEGEWESHLSDYENFLAYGQDNWVANSETIIGEFISDDEAALILKRSLKESDFEPIDIVFFQKYDGQWKVVLDNGMHLTSSFAYVVSRYSLLWRRIPESTFNEAPSLFQRFVNGWGSLFLGYYPEKFVGVNYVAECAYPVLCKLNSISLRELMDSNYIDQLSISRHGSHFESEYSSNMTVVDSLNEYIGYFELSNNFGIVVYEGREMSFQYFSAKSDERLILLAVGRSDPKLLNLLMSVRLLL